MNSTINNYATSLDSYLSPFQEVNCFQYITKHFSYHRFIFKQYFTVKRDRPKKSRKMDL